MANGWKRNKSATPCVVCGKSGWCTVAPDGTEAKCMRVPSDRPVKQKDGSIGYMHPLAGEQAAYAKSLKAAEDAPQRTKSEWEVIFRRYRSAITPQLVRKTADELGVSESSLQDLEICRDIGCDHWRGTADPCFPMRDGARKIIGMRIRHPDAYVRAKADRRRYTCVLGSSNGLFIPASFAPESLADAPSVKDEPLVLLLPEGPTDVAAARSLGFMAIGRPSNNGGSVLIGALLRNVAAVECIIVADKDEAHHLPDGTPFWPGWEGALSLAAQLADVPGVRKMLSMKQAGAKDLREWLVSGGHAAVFEGITKRAELVDAKWLARQRKILEYAKVKQKRKAG